MHVEIGELIYVVAIVLCISGMGSLLMLLIAMYSMR